MKLKPVRICCAELIFYGFEAFGAEAITQFLLLAGEKAARLHSGTPRLHKLNPVLFSAVGLRVTPPASPLPCVF